MLNRGDSEEAEDLAREVFEAQREALGDAHPGTLRAKACLATALAKQGDYLQAEPLTREVLLAWEATLGSDHPNTLSTKANLAAIHLKCGDYPSAEHLAREVLEVRERTMGAMHPSTLTAKANLAATMAEQGDAAGAECLARQVLQGWEQTLGPEHPHTLCTKSNLAATLAKQGNREEALALAGEVLTVRTRMLGGQHPSTLTAAASLEAIRNLRAQPQLQTRPKDWRELTSPSASTASTATPSTSTEGMNCRVVQADEIKRIPRNGASSYLTIAANSNGQVSPVRDGSDPKTQTLPRYRAANLASTSVVSFAANAEPVSSSVLLNLDRAASLRFSATRDDVGSTALFSDLGRPSSLKMRAIPARIPENSQFVEVPTLAQPRVVLPQAGGLVWS
jgi:tetratricopeptide (TPR) repeat protein